MSLKDRIINILAPIATIVFNLHLLLQTMIIGNRKRAAVLQHLMQIKARTA